VTLNYLEQRSDRYLTEFAGFEGQLRQMVEVRLIRPVTKMQL